MPQLPSYSGTHQGPQASRNPKHQLKTVINHGLLIVSLLCCPNMYPRLREPEAPAWNDITEMAIWGMGGSCSCLVYSQVCPTANASPSSKLVQLPKWRVTTTATFRPALLSALSIFLWLWQEGRVEVTVNRQEKVAKFLELAVEWYWCSISSSWPMREEGWGPDLCLLKDFD